jgi:hypothetical protein
MRIIEDVAEDQYHRMQKLPQTWKNAAILASTPCVRTGRAVTRNFMSLTLEAETCIFWLAGRFVMAVHM